MVSGKRSEDGRQDAYGAACGKTSLITNDTGPDQRDETKLSHTCRMNYLMGSAHGAGHMSITTKQLVLFR